jgi:hypothetical protein
MAAWDIKLIEHPSYSPDLASADFFLFPKVQRELADLPFTKDPLKKEWKGAIRSISAADFAEAFRQ